jgi:hypothetical protein
MNIDGFIHKCTDMSIATESASENNNKTTMNITGGDPTQLIKILAWVEFLGDIGHSTSFKVWADGDGSCRYKFSFEDKEIQKTYDSIIKDMNKEYSDNHKDIESFGLE